MLNLIKNECYKMISKPIVLVSLVLFFGFNILMFFCWGFNYGGKEDIDKNAAYTAQFQGHFTDEKMQTIYQDFLKEPEVAKEYYKGHSTYDTINSCFINKNDGFLMTLEQTFSTNYESNVKDNLVFADTTGPSLLINVLTKIYMFIGFILIIAISPIFSDEYTLGMDALILTSRYGKNKVITAKLTASFLFTLLVTGGTILIQTIGFLTLYGTSGFQGSVQMNPLKLMSDVPYLMTFSQAMIQMTLVWLFTALFTTLTCTLLSAVCRTSFLSLIGGLVVYILPLVASPFLSKAKVPVEIWCIFPFNASTTTIFTISKNYYLIVILFCVVSCIIMAVGSHVAFKNHQVR